jgi:GcrA cell cycle regulator
MEMTNWAPEHSGALRDYLAQGMSFSQIAKAINAKFNTAYSRNATIGRARRLGLMGPDRPASPLAAQPQLDRLGGLRASEPKSIACHWPAPVSEDAKPARLRCVEIEPVIFHCSNSSGAIAGIPTAETKRAKRSPSAAIHGSRAQATARRIFTSAEIPHCHRSRQSVSPGSGSSSRREAHAVARAYDNNAATQRSLSPHGEANLRLDPY